MTPVAMGNPSARGSTAQTIGYVLGVSLQELKGALSYPLFSLIKIHDRATKALADSFHEGADLVWDAYEATNKASFLQRLRRLHEWAILWIFCPSCPTTVKKTWGHMSPAERLNSKRYDDI